MGSSAQGLHLLRADLGGPDESIDAWVAADGMLRREVVRMPAPTPTPAVKIAS